jgi:signal transduction histidine kinase
MGGILALWSRNRLKNAANRRLKEQNEQVISQKQDLERHRDSLELKNLELKLAQETIEAQNARLRLANVELEEKVRERTAELSQAYSDLMQSDQEFRTFMYRASHDLKGPIATLLGLCNVALLDVQEPMSLDYLGMLRQTMCEWTGC